MKKLWKNNKVLVLLLGILLICFIAILVVAISFMRPTGSDPRLKDIEKYPITKKFQDSFKESLLDNENVIKSTINTNKDKSRVIYINIYFDETAELDYAKEVATKSLDLFEEDYLKYYEIHFILKSENPDYEENIKELNKKLKDEKITQEEYDEEIKESEYQEYNFNVIGAKNLNVDHISWTNNGDKHEKK